MAQHVASSQDSVIAEDVNRVYARMKAQLDERARETLLERAMMDRAGELVLPFHEFLGYDARASSAEYSNKIADALQGVFFKKALDLVEHFNIVDAWDQRYDDDQKRDFAAYSEPLLELAGNLGSEQLGVDRMPELMIGYDGSDGKKIEKLRDKLGREGAHNNIRFTYVLSDRELDYLLLFYKEEGLIYMDENLATSALFLKAYMRRLKGAEIYGGLHTHKDGSMFFDIKMKERTE